MSTATTVYDHAFEPDDREYSALCRNCHLAEASHIQRGSGPPAPPEPPTADGGPDEPDDEQLPPSSTFEINMLDHNWLLPPQEPGDRS